MLKVFHFPCLKCVLSFILRNQKSFPPLICLWTPVKISQVGLLNPKCIPHPFLSCRDAFDIKNEEFAQLSYREKLT